LHLHVVTRYALQVTRYRCRQRPAAGSRYRYRYHAGTTSSQLLAVAAVVVAAAQVVQELRAAPTPFSARGKQGQQGGGNKKRTPLRASTPPPHALCAASWAHTAIGPEPCDYDVEKFGDDQLRNEHAIRSEGCRIEGGCAGQPPAPPELRSASLCVPRPSCPPGLANRR
jgi:hypothetical protein